MNIYEYIYENYKMKMMMLYLKLFITKQKLKI